MAKILPRSPIEKIGKVSTESVLNCTGKNWNTWISLLEKAGATAWTHKEIVHFLKTKHQLSLWWQQGVATGFEIFAGKRIEGQNLKGDYSTVATKTFQLDPKSAWNLITSDEGLNAWLKPLEIFVLEPETAYEVDGGIFGKVRTVTPGSKMRLAWQATEWPKPSTIQIKIVPLKKISSVIVIDHQNLTSAKLRDEMRDHWKQALADLHTIAPKRVTQATAKPKVDARSKKEPRTNPSNSQNKTSNSAKTSNPEDPHAPESEVDWNDPNRPPKRGVIVKHESSRAPADSPLSTSRKPIRPRKPSAR